MLLFLSDSFRIETTNTVIHSHSYHENHTQFQTKMARAKSIPVLRPKWCKSPHPLGLHIPILAHIREYPSPPPPPGVKS